MVLLTIHVKISEGIKIVSMSKGRRLNVHRFTPLFFRAFTLLVYLNFGY